MEFNCENCGWSKVVGSPIFCEYSEKRTFRENCCEAWKPKNNPVTNADRIRAMTDEELADWLGVYCNGQTAQEVWKPCVSGMGSCEECWLDWLKEEVVIDE